MLNNSCNNRELIHLLIDIGYRIGMPYTLLLKILQRSVFDRRIGTRLDILKPTDHSARDIAGRRQVWYHKGKELRSFNVGEKVYVGDYRMVNKKKWIDAVVVRYEGTKVYQCRLRSGEVWRRHT